MQNEGLHAEIEVQTSRNETLQNENTQLQKQVEKLSSQLKEQLQSKDLEIEKLKQELEILKSQSTSSLSNLLVSPASSEDPRNNQEVTCRNEKESQNIFDQI